MKVDAIIFDKDGTLIDFDAFWVEISVRAIGEVLSRLEMQAVDPALILEAFGVHDGVTDVDGILCMGTYAAMGHVVYEILREHGGAVSEETVTQTVIDAYNRHSDAGVIKPTVKTLASVLRDWKGRGKRLALVTTDNELITRKCLRGLGVEDVFDKIYTDDGIMPKKPDPSCALDFCKRYGLQPSRVAVVGDTITDVRFARNAGLYSVCLAKNEHNRDRLAPHADVVIPDLSHLDEVLE